MLLRPLGQLSKLAPQAGFEPATVRLTAECSTTELLRNNIAWQRPTLTGKTQLPSALKNLTSVFGMGTGVTSSLSPPDTYLSNKNYYTCSLHYVKNFFVLSKLDNVFTEINQLIE